MCTEYSRTVELLAAECGCPLEHPIAVKFRSYVMDGDWDQVINVYTMNCQTCLACSDCWLLISEVVGCWHLQSAGCQLIFIALI